jgi:hypothetical protein
MKAHSQSAQFLLKNLKKKTSPSLIQVFLQILNRYLFSSQINDFGYGGMLTIDCKTPEKVLQLASKLQKINFGLYAVSLGFSRIFVARSQHFKRNTRRRSEEVWAFLQDLRISLGYVGDDYYVSAF